MTPSQSNPSNSLSPAGVITLGREVNGMTQEGLQVAYQT